MKGWFKGTNVGYIGRAHTWVRPYGMQELCHKNINTVGN